MSPHNHSVPLMESQHHVINPTNPRGALDDGVEHRLHVRRRAADDAEHLGRCRLMLQGLAQFCVALLQFLEQPHVLDRDDRLIGEGFEQSDLLVGERTNFGSANCNHPDRNAFAQQRRGQNGPNTRLLDDSLTSGNSASRSASKIMNVDRSAGREWLGQPAMPRSIGRVSPTPRTGIGP